MLKVRPTKNELKKTLLNRIERFESFEEKYGIELQNISIKVVNYDKIKVFCEVHSNDNTTLNESVNIECVLLNKEGSIIERDNTFISNEGFYGFVVVDFSFYEEDIVDQINKIRIYPTK